MKYISFDVFSDSEEAFVVIEISLLAVHLLAALDIMEEPRIVPELLLGTAFSFYSVTRTGCLLSPQVCAICSLPLIGTLYTKGSKSWWQLEYWVCNILPLPLLLFMWSSVSDPYCIDQSSFTKETSFAFAIFTYFCGERLAILVCEFQTLLH